MGALVAARTIAYWVPEVMAPGGLSGTETQEKDGSTLTLVSRTIALATTVFDGTPPATVLTCTVKSPGLPPLLISRSTWSRLPLMPAVNVCATHWVPCGDSNDPVVVV
jgi:hypothetical protein